MRSAEVVSNDQKRLYGTSVSKSKSKELQLGMLEYFRDFCRTHKLRYYLSYGTLLGAARHKGYIPWDDDIDLMMPREDYLKFIELFCLEEHGSFELLSIQNNKLYFAPFAKIINNQTIMFQEYEQVEKVEIGVYVDIFPLDGLPLGEKESNKVFKKMKNWDYAYKLSIRKITAKSSNSFKWVVKTLLSIPFRLLGSYFVIKRYESLAMANGYDNGEEVACLVSGEGSSERIRRDHIEGTAELEFEGNHYPVPSRWDIYLENIYGDYMKLPPEDERKPHSNTVFWR